MNKRWIPISILGGLLAAGLTTGAVMAQNASPTPAPQTFSSRLAEKLGVDEAKVKAAVESTRREVQDERVTAYLAKLVADGKITPAQSDEYLTWYKARPEAMGNFFGRIFGHGGRGHGGPGPRMGGRDGEHPAKTKPAATTPAAIAAA